MLRRTLIPSITTAGSSRNTWEATLKTVPRLKISVFAVFLTGLNYEERQRMYGLLEKMQLRHSFTIPFVHARADMQVEEYAYLMNQFGTEKFNLHPTREVPLLQPLPLQLRRRIYIENTFGLRRQDLKGFAGICTDISHLEDYRRQGQTKISTEVHQLVKEFPVGVSHVSAITASPYVFKNGTFTYAPHKATGLTDLDYLKRYPKYFFGEYIAIELTNSLSEQLDIIQYIETCIWKTKRLGSTARQALPTAYVPAV